MPVRYAIRLCIALRLLYSRSRTQLWQQFLILEQVWQIMVVLVRLVPPGAQLNTV